MRNLDLDSNPNGRGNSPSTPDGALPLLAVQTRTFIVLSFCTFGLQERYWCDQNCKRLRATSGVKKPGNTPSIRTTRWPPSLP